jgi:uncharacterized SAM-binding protein YcdF (DUF218 family)
MRRRLARVLLVTTGAVVLAACYLAGSIYAYSDNTADVQAEAAIVLGAAVWSREPSPVFRERINHAVELYRRGRVRKIIFTGGRGNRDEPTEAAAAKVYALRRGVPETDILLETQSHTTYQNLANAKRLAKSRGINRVLVVSDPLHMKRAMCMARDLGLEAYPSPTETSRYRTAGSRFGLLMHETYYYAGHLLRRLFGRPE